MLAVSTNADAGKSNARNSDRPAKPVSGRTRRTESLAPTVDIYRACLCREVFSFLYLKKIKISKIYGGFEKFQNYTPVAPCLGDRGPVAPWLGDMT